MKVAICPGHHEHSAGYYSPTLGEYEFDLAQLITQVPVPPTGIEIVTFRGTLKDKVKLINAAGCDAALDIHFNAGGSSSSGSECLYTSSNGKILATSVLDGLVRATSLKSRGVKKESDLQRFIHGRPFRSYFLHQTECPATIVEVLFLSNPEEARLLRNDDFVVKVRRGIMDGIAQWARATHRLTVEEPNG